MTMWSRLLVPVVAGEAPTALQRVAAAADFGNGLSRILDFETHVFINPDLTVGLARLPGGEWIGFDMVSRLSSDGFGQAESLIFDAGGPVGRAVQSLIVEAPLSARLGDCQQAAAFGIPALCSQSQWVSSSGS